MNDLSWSQVIDRPSERLEFGACHVNLGWRRHKAAQSKFLGLESAFARSSHRIPVLLQSVGSNYNARNHPERGQALFAAVWFKDVPWAILCSPTHATLVRRSDVEAIAEKKERDDTLVRSIQALFDATPQAVRRPLDDQFCRRHLQST